MTKDLIVTTIQAPLVWEDASANTNYFTKQMEALGNTDLVVLPEMFNTGFSMTPKRVAEKMGGQTMTWMAVQAALLDAVVLGSIAIEEDGKYYNRLIWMRPDGDFEQYDKRHLFAMAGEHKEYSAGQSLLVVEWKGWRICPLVCYDLRFPVWSRNTIEYDLLIYVANWPEKRRYAWKSLLRARAIENQAWTIGVNRVGEDGNGFRYSGDTCLIEPSGEKVLYCDEGEMVRTSLLSMEKLQNTRSRLPFLEDRDSFKIEI